MLVDGHDDVNTDGHQVDLDVDADTIAATVTAEAGSTTTTYTAVGVARRLASGGAPAG